MTMDAASLPLMGLIGEDGTHYLPVRVFYEDTDFTGMVYHANYVRFCERGRSSMLQASGVSHQDLLNRPDPCAFTIIRVEMDFKRPARVGDLLTVETRFPGRQGVRIPFHQTIRREGEVLAEAVITAVAIHMNGRPRLLPADILALLDPLAQGNPTQG